MKWDREEIAEFLGSIGAALLIAGYLRYSIQCELLADEQDPADRRRRDPAGRDRARLSAPFVGFFSKRSSKLGTNTSVLTLGVIAILVVVNLLGYQHHKRFDLTTEKLYTLSDQTKKIVGGLKNDVNDRPLFEDARPALRRIDDRIPQSRARTQIPERRPAGKARSGQGIRRAAHRRRHCCPRGAKKQTIPPSPDGAAQRIGRHQRDPESDAGQGEDGLLRDRPRRKGDSTTQASGYSSVDQGLKKEGYNTKSVNLVSQNGVPSDCDVLVIAGPTQAFFPQEAAMVEQVYRRRRKGADRNRSGDRSEA